MKRLCLLLICGLGLPIVAAAAPLPIDLRVRTAGDLAALCASDPTSAAADAKINFCHGFAQGAVDDRLAVAEKRPFCFPNPTPSRSQTMREFVGWVRSSPSNRDMPVLEGLFKFLGERFPCKP
jgi:hypothetical protein